VFEHFTERARRAGSGSGTRAVARVPYNDAYGPRPLSMIAVLLAIYLAAMLAIGIASRRAGSRSEASFYVADRSYGPFRGFVALASTTTGGSATLVCAALVYRHGLSPDPLGDARLLVEPDAHQGKKLIHIDGFGDVVGGP